MKLLGMALVGAIAFVPAATADVRSSARLSMIAGEREPANPRKLDATEVQKLRAAVTAAPKDREARFALVRALVASKQLDAALVAAREWRAADAYNLVVVRLLGDIYSELGDRKNAQRVLGGRRVVAEGRQLAARARERAQASRRPAWCLRPVA